MDLWYNSSNFGLVGRTGALHTSYCTRGPFKKRCTDIPRASFFRPFFDSMSNIRFWPIVTLAPFRVELDRETEQVNPKALDKTKSLVNFFRSRSTFRVFFKKQSTAVTRAEKGVPLRPQPPIGKQKTSTTAPVDGLDRRTTPPASPTPAVVRPRPARRHFYDDSASSERSLFACPSPPCRPLVAMFRHVPPSGAGQVARGGNGRKSCVGVDDAMSEGVRLLRRVAA